MGLEYRSEEGSFSDTLQANPEELGEIEANAFEGFSERMSCYPLSIIIIIPHKTSCLVSTGTLL